MRRARQRVGTAVTSTVSLARRADSSAARTVASCLASAAFTRPRASPTSLPAAAFWSAGTSRSVALSCASGECSPACAARAAFRLAESSADAIAASAASTAAETAFSVIAGVSGTVPEFSRAADAVFPRCLRRKARAGHTVGMSDSPATHAAPSEAPRTAPGDPKLGRTALTFAIIVLIAGLAASVLIALFATTYSPDDTSGFAQRPDLLPATMHFLGGSILGIIAIVLGLRAAYLNRGRKLGVVAVLLAGAAPFLSMILWAIVTTVFAH